MKSLRVEKSNQIKNSRDSCSAHIHILEFCFDLQDKNQ